MFADDMGEHDGKIKYKGGKILQQWRGSGGN